MSKGNMGSANNCQHLLSARVVVVCMAMDRLHQEQFRYRAELEHFAHPVDGRFF